MPNRPSVLHPRALSALRDLGYPSAVAIEAATVIRDPESGQATETWATVPGLGAIPAAIAPAVLQSGRSQESATPEAVWVADAWAFSLNGYYPQITPRHRVRRDDGRLYNIVGVEHDSHQQLTRIKGQGYVDAG